MSFVKLCLLADLFEKKLEQKRQLRDDEGDNVDKMADMKKSIQHHLDSIIPLVDDGQMDHAESNAKAIEGLAQAMQFLIREMDIGNG